MSQVLFVCLHGSAKSLIAARHFDRLAAQRGLDLRAMPAGVEPDPEVPRAVVEGLRADGIDVHGFRPHRLTRRDLAAARHVVSFGCDLGAHAPAECAIEQWDDLPLVSENFAAARDAIVARLTRLVDALARSPS